MAGGRFLPRFLVRGIFYTLVGWYFLWINPFGISDRTDLATQEAIYRLIAPLYDSAARDDIVVVLLTEPAIRDLHRWRLFEANEWPVRYRDHAWLLSRILSLSPRSVFVDVYFRRERTTDDSHPRMVATLERLSARREVPLYFAGNFPGEPLTPIQQKLAAFATVTVNGWDGYGRSYPLRIEDEYTTAWQLYAQACLDAAPLASCHAVVPTASLAPGDALSLYWGSRSAPTVFPEFRKADDDCRATPDDLAGVAVSMITYLYHGLLGRPERARATCAYHATLYANELIAVLKRGTPEQRARLRRAVEGRIVLYGLALEGLHDTVPTPVHGRLPGVYLHAMALDNLISLGHGYIRATDDFIEWLSMALWAVLALAFAWGACRLEGHSVPAAPEAPPPGAGRWRVAGWRLLTSARRHPRTAMFVAGTLVILIVCGALFVWLRYEPVNSVGFISLLGAITLLRESRLERWFVKRFHRISTRLFGRPVITEVTETTREETP